MASLAEMERDLTIECTGAGLEAARKLGGVLGRNRVMTESKVASARKLLENGTPRREVRISASPCRHSIAGFLPQQPLSVQFPFSETTPTQRAGEGERGALPRSPAVAGVLPVSYFALPAPVQHY
jgi:hypothetical protein